MEQIFGAFRITGGSFDGGAASTNQTIAQAGQPSFRRSIEKDTMAASSDCPQPGAHVPARCHLAVHVPGVLYAAAARRRLMRSRAVSPPQIPWQSGIPAVPSILSASRRQEAATGHRWQILLAAVRRARRWPSSSPSWSKNNSGSSSRHAARPNQGWTDHWGNPTRLGRPVRGEPVPRPGVCLVRASDQGSVARIGPASLIPLASIQRR
jgi:hypothetical protein